MRIGRALAALLLAALGALAWVESRSALAEAVRGGKPWLCWLALKPPLSGDEAPMLFLALYRPARRTLDLVYMPENAREEGQSLSEIYRRGRHEAPKGQAAGAMSKAAWNRTLPDLPGPPENSPGFIYVEPEEPLEGTEPPLAAKAWILGWSRGLTFWTRLFKSLLRPPPMESTLSRFDLLLLALEIHRLPPEAVHPAWLPDKDSRRPLFGRLLSPGSATPSSPITVEVLNASERKGLASEATKVLRWKGADVVNYGNTAGPRSRTLIYDRAGVIENAALVREMLGCPDAQTLTQVSSKRLVEVSVILAEDCASR